MSHTPLPATEWQTHLPHPDRVFVALDTDSPEQARHWVTQLAPLGFQFKVGMQLYYRTGPDFVRALQQDLNATVFVDLKLHDIPNTVQQAAKALTHAGARFFNVHCQGGLAMMQAAKAGAQAANGDSPPIIIGVTLLTSLDEQTLQQQLGVPLTTEAYVVKLAQLAQQAGLDGVVCSAMEAPAIRQACGPDFLLVTPGIRLPNDSTQDQSRVLTPQAALAAGADYLVVGRSITEAAFLGGFDCSQLILESTHQYALPWFY
jgi:orotidine-5'-phosphate decarboxylase